MRENGVGPNGTQSSDGESEWTQDQPACHYLAEDDGEEQVCGGLNHLVPRNSGGTQKKVTVAVDSEAAENVMPKNLFPEISTEETERSKNGKGFKGPRGGSTSRTTVSSSRPSELQRDSCVRARGRSEM